MPRNVAISCTVLLACAVMRATALELPPHPRLLITRAEVPEVLRRAGRMAGARAFYQDLQRRCEAALRGEVKLPERGGQWWHWYSCSRHGARLRTEGPTRHVCPIDGEAFTGYPYDDVVLSAEHDALAASARELGLLYVLQGERKWADRARAILMAYAERYLSYPMHNTQGQARVGGGRVLPQTLDESIWLIRMAQAADAVWDVLTPADREVLRARLFYPAAVDVIQKHRMSIHNIQCWKNAAVGCVGLLYGDQTLIADAIDGPTGFRAQVARGVRDDGAWYEGAWSYHFYTMDALCSLTEPARRCGIDLYDDRLMRAFVAPLDLAQPDGKLPAFNDSGVATAVGNANYELALARWKDPRLADALRGSPRRSLQALLQGVDPLPAAGRTVPASRNIEASGYVILRAGTGVGAAWLCLKYGPHGGGHGHPDKGSFVLYAGGKVLAGDPGTSAYGVPIHAGWYKTTLAHNTLLTDETSQLPAEGKCLAFRRGAGWSAALVDAGEAIPDVTFRRAAFLLGGDLAVFIDTARATDGKARKLDLAYHPAGAWGSPELGEPCDVGKRPGYAYLGGIRRRTTSAAVALLVNQLGSDAGPVPGWVVFAGGEATEYLAGTGVGGSTDDRVPIVIARRNSTQTVYVWAVSLRAGAEPPRLTRAEPAAPGTTTVRVTWQGRTWTVSVDDRSGSTGPVAGPNLDVKPPPR